MSTLTIQFELPEDAAHLDGRKLSVALGEGVSLVTNLPPGIERINSIVLQVVMQVEGAFNDKLKQPPIERVHETPTNGGLEERQNGGPSELGSGGVQTESS